MIIIYFPKTLGGVSFEKLVNFMRGENPFFSIKRVFSPQTPLFPKRTTKGEAPLESPRLSYLSLIVFLWFLSIFTNTKFPFLIPNSKSPFHHKLIPLLRLFQLELGSFLFVLLGFCLFPHMKSCGKCG